MDKVEIVQIRPWYHKPAPWIALGVFICLGVLAMPHVQRAYYRWSEVRKVKRATEALARGDYKEAALQARGALATDAKHVEALRVLAKMAEQVNSPTDALKLRRQIDAIKPGDAENVLGIAENCVKTSVFGAAEEALRGLPENARTGARYYDVAAGLALGQKDVTRAEEFAAKAVQAEPANGNYRLRLAGMRLASKSDESRAEGIKVLRELSAQPEFRSRALRSLLQDALEHSDPGAAIELGSALAASSDAVFTDKLTHLTSLYILREKSVGAASTSRPVSQAEFQSRLEELQKEAKAQPETLYQIIGWMNDHSMALLVPEYLATISPEMLAKPPVCIAVADAHTRGSQWASLRKAVEPVSWERVDFLRLAYLSRALEGLDDHAGAVAAWTRAVESTKGQVVTLEALARETSKWGWKQQNEDLLWKLAENEKCPRWVIDTLWESGLKRQDPVQLYKLSKRILQAEPKSLVARNHYISLALITGQESDSPHNLAEAQYKGHPENIAVASTYGFSLFMQGRAEEAVTVMAAFPKEVLRRPAVAFYYGMFLVGAGRAEEGEEYFRIGEEAPQFEPLVVIRNFLRTVFEADAVERSGDQARSAQAWQAALQTAQVRAQWLDILGRLAMKRGRIDRAGEAALKLAEMGQCPSWAVEPLWTASLRTGNPAQIQKASQVISDANPKSLAARGNVISAKLLAGKEGAAAYQLAEVFSRENPGQPDATLPYAYALFRQGQSDKALALLRTLDAQQLQQPRLALYSSLLLSAVTGANEAAAALPKEMEAGFFPEEKAMGGILRLAFESRAAGRQGDTARAKASWTQAIAEAQNRAEMLELLGQMAQKWQTPERAEEALWKLADTQSPPRWAIDFLVASAEKRRDTPQLYRAVRLLRRAEPENVAIRNRFVRLSLLTGQTADKADRMARDLSEASPKDPEIAVTFALALHLQKRTDKAVELMNGFKAEELRTPRVAFYYGVFLQAAGQGAKAEEYQKIGSGEPLFPEEEALLSGAGAGPMVKKIP